ncbi:MAG: hypothetical protein CML17_00405 [Pusillimonas sp.]|nr:hypothetical protein [Pusillimonas sp.]
MIKNIATRINQKGRLTLTVDFDSKDIKLIQSFSERIVEFINENLQTPYTIDKVNFYDDSQAVEDLKNIFKLGVDSKK